MAVVEAVGLGRRFGALHALQGVSFAVEPGRVVGLLGPNGAGKTTAMKILCGVLAPTSGTVRVAGHDVLHDPVAARRHLGWLPEGAPHIAEITVRAALRFAARIRGLGPAQTSRALERTEASCGLTGRLDQSIGTLSRGFRQRVGLAQALVHEPEILILDEPTTGLDPNQVAEMRALVRDVGRTRTVLLSTHVLSEVTALCDRVLILHRGRLVADDSPQTLVASARGTALRVTVAPGKVSLSRAALQEQLGALPGVRATTPVATDGALRFELTADVDVREAVFRWAVAGGHVLVELSPHHRDLEEVFRHLTEAP